MKKTFTNLVQPKYLMLANLFNYVMFHLVWLVRQLFPFFDNSSTESAAGFFHKKTVSYLNKNTKSNVYPIEIIYKDYLTVDDLEKLTFDKPILFKNLGKESNSVKNWSFEYFEKFGDISQPAGSATEKNFSISPILVSEILKDLKQPQHRLALYSGNLVEENLQLKSELDEYKFLDRNFFKNKINPSRQLFISGKDLKSKLHTEMGSILTLQIIGKKKWTLHSPKYSYLFFPFVSRHMFIRSDLFANGIKNTVLEKIVNSYEVTLEAGDVLYCPSFYWHYVETIENSLSVGIKWNTLLHLVKHPFLSTVILTARQPSLFSKFFGTKKMNYQPPGG